MQVLVATGFIAKNPAGQVTTLRRNGSDYSATIVGALLRSARIVIWTDVDGVFSADPRKARARRPRGCPCGVSACDGAEAYTAGAPAPLKRAVRLLRQARRPCTSGRLVSKLCGGLRSAGEGGAGRCCCQLTARHGSG